MCVCADCSAFVFENETKPGCHDVSPVGMDPQIYRFVDAQVLQRPYSYQDTGIGTSNYLCGQCSEHYLYLRASSRTTRSTVNRAGQ